MNNPVSLSLVYAPEPVAEPADVVDIVRRWHDDTHSHAFQMCSEQPCHAVQAAIEYSDGVAHDAAGRVG